MEEDGMRQRSSLKRTEHKPQGYEEKKLFENSQRHKICLVQGSVVDW